MGEKLTIRSATVDKNGDYVALEQMQEYVNTVNGERKLRYLANHRRDLPPVGYISNAEIRQIENIYHALAEPVVFINREQVSWDQSLLMEDAGIPLSFIRRDHGSSVHIRIAMDKNNFGSFESFEHTGEHLIKIFDQELKLEGSMRKSYLPDPQMVITLAGYYTILYPILKPFLTKMGEKIAEDIAEDAYQLAKTGSKKLIASIADSVRLARKNMIPKNKVLLTIFEIPGSPYIELQVKSDDPKRIAKAISDKQLFKMHKKVIDLQSKIEISEICFLFNVKDKWEFTYLLTKQGQVIGTKTVFKKRDNLLRRINLSPTRALSLGADAVQYERSPNNSRPNPAD
ncbi:hypothetical protein [Pedobacter psychroterrae]|uniref:Uncharacterized protein n=1 Tax=Pedobacter psychroterrae TaxID=2530453 RepID=A0A4R0NQC0_9SPHI|nr:hypothetical protein [Pedobacter psychroterrae]TCD03221.1 hypothetical protein EZ437_04405 [Pedobacter psychroterrae]